MIYGLIPMALDDLVDLINWKQCNVMVQGQLVSSMEKEIKDSVKYAIPTQNMCLDLEEMFGKVNAPKAYELN